MIDSVVSWLSVQTSAWVIAATVIPWIGLLVAFYLRLDGETITIGSAVLSICALIGFWIEGPDFSWKYIGIDGWFTVMCYHFLLFTVPICCMALGIGWVNNDLERSWKQVTGRDQTAQEIHKEIGEKK